MNPLLLRYLKLLSGSGIRTSKATGAPIGKEVAKTVGTQLGTAGAIAGLGYGGKKVVEHYPELKDMLDNVFHKSRIGRVMDGLGIKTSQYQYQDPDTQLRTSLLSLLAGGVPAGLGQFAHETLPDLKPRERIAKRILALSQKHHKGVIEGSQYAFDSNTRKIHSPDGLKGNVGAIAHEAGHAMDPVLKRTGRLHNILRGAGGFAGSWGAMAASDRDTARNYALGGSALALPTLAHETYAGIKGMQLLRQTSRKIPTKVLLRAMSGLPSYAGAALAPLAVYGTRSALGGFGDKND